MEPIISALASLLGVALGATLTSLGRRRAATPALFQEARTAVAYAHAAHTIYTSDHLGGAGSVDFSEQLLLTMATERNAALVTARRALSNLSPFSRDFEPYARNIGEIQDETVLTALLNLIDREQRYALRLPLPVLKHIGGRQ